MRKSTAFVPFDETWAKVMRKLGLRTQTELARTLGVRQATISEAKRRGSFPAEWIVKLYREHGIDPVWMLDGTPDGTANADAPGRQLGASASPDQPGHVVAKITDSTTGDVVGDMVLPVTRAGESIRVIRYDNAGMEPLIPKGALAGIDTARTAVAPGEIFALELPLSGIVLGRLHVQALHADEPIVTFRTNADPDLRTFTPIELALRLLGRLAWVIRDF